MDVLRGFKTLFDILVANTLYGCQTTCGDDTYLQKRLDLVQQSPNVAVDLLDPPQDRVGVHYEVHKSRVGHAQARGNVIATTRDTGRRGSAIAAVADALVEFL